MEIAAKYSFPARQASITKVTFESGTADPGIWRMPRLAACGFDVLFIITDERHLVIEEENELLTRFRELSQRGRASVEDVDIEFTPEALKAIAHQAIERKTGARGLRSICEAIMMDTMFDIPSTMSSA